jgi:hypothetical protein
MRFSRIPKDNITRVEIRVNPFTTTLLEPFDMFRLVLEKVTSSTLLFIQVSGSTTGEYPSANAYNLKCLDDFREERCTPSHDPQSTIFFTIWQLGKRLSISKQDRQKDHATNLRD